MGCEGIGKSHGHESFYRVPDIGNLRTSWISDARQIHEKVFLRREIYGVGIDRERPISNL
ncbi:hypothetical protein MU1_11030 [Paenibacillus glycanilyticus]|uniref:Uncharacterized protein n=1 Tax=Paenibacillus glycanilyticus TaxID=126569 RepID=A0ABQ6G6Z6_9BACL|nr:hypothetical protein MU1_11030 [Paenibacillus glycanilyticus]